VRPFDPPSASNFDPGPQDPPPPQQQRERTVPAVLRVAAVASLAAGAIHATAAGAHSEHRSAVIAFVAVAVAQIAWGAVALARSGVAVSLTGAAINAAAVGGWILAKTSGISFVSGLDVAEDPQFADTLSAALAAVAVAGALLALASGTRWVARPRPVLVGVAGISALALVVPGMVSTGSHEHAGGGHDDGHDMAGMDDHDMAEMEHEEAAASTPPVPYTATLPVDLGGVPGVTPAQQRAAEAVVTRSIKKLPQFADWRALEAQGWHSIGDGFGPGAMEHFNNWPLMNDDHVLDPDYPESLVFRIEADGSKTLVAAMYMFPRGMKLSDVPNPGGALMQFHEHNDLCFMGPENQWRVAGIAPPGTDCRPGTFRLGAPAPMVHVWIVPTPCGPFASLEGEGGGQLQPGETRLCDHAHAVPE
jgi:hypothetical protein